MGASQKPSIPEHVVHEEIDGEVVVINLETGVYYSLEGAAAHVWRAVSAGDLNGTIEHLAAERALDLDTARRAGEAFVASLGGEGLLAGVGESRVDGESNALGLELHRYLDMQDLLVIDPIHEVDDRGWPNRAPGA